MGMTRQKCRSCQGNHGVQVHVEATNPRGATRVWTVIVCRDCWRAWEAMLDVASLGYQPTNDDHGQLSMVWLV